MLSLVFLSLCSFAFVYGQNCASTGCPSNAPCCSKWGWCGSSADHCGANCQSGCPGGTTAPTGTTKKGDWEFCSSNAECNNNCCSRQYSDDGKLKCTPGGTQCTGSTPAPTTGSSGSTGGSGSISSIISEADFNRALGACGVRGHTDLYRTLVNGGFTAPLKDKNELALLIGNLAHESGAFQYTEEIACAGVTTVTAQCPYGLYHGRGYIQLSWDYNYRAAANYLGNQQILNNPNVVRDDLKVNLQTVQWFWVNSVQPRLKSSGYTLANSVRAINGGLECGGNPINNQRIRYVQCFQREYGVPVDSITWCATDATSVSEEPSSTEQAPAITDIDSDVESTVEESGVPGYAVGLLVLASLFVTLLVVVLVLIVTRKPSTETI